MTYPVCPYCNQGMIRTHEKDDEHGWRVVWLCACQPDPETVARMEQKIQTLQSAGTKTTIVRRTTWVRS